MQTSSNKAALIPTLAKRYLTFICIILFIFVLLVVYISPSSIQRPPSFLKAKELLQLLSPIQILNITPATVAPSKQSFQSLICDKNNTNRFPSSSTTPSKDSFDIYRNTALQKYCDIVPIPEKVWTNAQTYTERDIAFVIFTAASFFHTRATAARDTWLSRITNYYFLSATPYPYLPITVVPGAGEDKLSNMKKLFYGLQIIYQQQMNLSVSNRQKWFYIAGCDTFILPHHLLKRLDGFNYTEPVFIGGHSGEHPCIGDKPPQNVVFPSGGAGFFFSIKLLEMMQPHLTDYVENVWPNKSEISDVALTCLAARLGVRLQKRGGFWAHAPTFTLREEGRERFHQEPEPNNFHYVQPDEMYALDEFYVNQHMDRLIKDNNWSELAQYTRRFVASHYELLRKKRQECTLPKVGNPS